MLVVAPFSRFLLSSFRACCYFSQCTFLLLPPLCTCYFLFVFIVFPFRITPFFTLCWCSPLCAWYFSLSCLLLLPSSHLLFLLFVLAAFLFYICYFYFFCACYCFSIPHLLLPFSCFLFFLCICYYTLFVLAAAPIFTLVDASHFDYIIQNARISNGY